MRKRKSVFISRKPSTANNSAVTETTPPETLPEPEGALQTLNVVGPEQKKAAPEADLGVIGKAVYGTVYCLSFGVAFGVLLVGKLLPGSRMIGRAMCDGTHAATRVFASFEAHEAEAKAVSLDTTAEGLAAT